MPQRMHDPFRILVDCLNTSNFSEVAKKMKNLKSSKEKIGHLDSRNDFK